MAIIIALIIVKIVDWWEENRFNNYLPPHGYKIDNDKMMKDLNKYGYNEVRNNYTMGKYNIKDEEQWKVKIK